jgi:hypothetical protein
MKYNRFFKKQNEYAISSEHTITLEALDPDNTLNTTTRFWSQAKTIFGERVVNAREIPSHEARGPTEANQSHALFRTEKI